MKDWTWNQSDRENDGQLGLAVSAVAEAGALLTLESAMSVPRCQEAEKGPNIKHRGL